MNDLMGLLTKSLTPQLLGKIAQLVDEPEEGVGKAFGGIFPLLLGAMMKKGSEAGSATAMEEIVGLLKAAPTPEALGDHASWLLDSVEDGKGPIAEQAGKFLPLILGHHTHDILTFISKVSGLKSTSVAPLFNAAAPLLLGHLSQAMQGKFSVGSLFSYLVSQKESIGKAAPEGLGKLFGVANFNDLSANLNNIVTIPTIKAKAEKKSSKLPWLMLALLLIGAFFLWKSCQKTETLAVGEGTIVTATDWAHLGIFNNKQLPSGIVLNIPEKGIENKLIAYIENTTIPLADAPWISFDRLNFDTNSATLKESSVEQLNNIAEILRAYPNVDLIVGGYTDSTGNIPANLALSQARAEVVKNGVVALGVAEHRLSAVGYGEEFPVAPNDSQENRAKNRRIDVRVSKK